MTTINDIPGNTPAEQRDWLFAQWCGVSNLLNRAIAQRDELRKRNAALLAHIDAQDAEITALKALRQRVDDADIGMLSDAHGDTLPLRLAREWFGYIWHGDQKPEDVDKNTSAQDAEIAALREAVRNLGGDPDQAWYWTDAWQAKEREADEDLRAGRYADADDIDTLLAD